MAIIKEDVIIAKERMIKAAQAAPIYIPDLKDTKKWIKAIVIPKGQFYIAEIYCLSYMNSGPVLFQLSAHVRGSYKVLTVNVKQSQNSEYGGRLKIKQTDNETTIWIRSAALTGTSGIIKPILGDVEYPIIEDTPPEDAIEYA